MSLSRVLLFLARWLSRPRVIYDLDGVSPYLSRYYLLGGRPKMPDGSPPFDVFGDPKEGIIWPEGRGLYLHRFHRGDKDRELHNHPWLWSLAFVLSGGYREERRHGDVVVERLMKPGRFNWIGHNDFHRVELLKGEAWTLFLAGPKVSSWGFWDRRDNSIVPWRVFHERHSIRGVKVPNEASP